MLNNQSLFFIIITSFFISPTSLVCMQQDEGSLYPLDFYQWKCLQIGNQRTVEFDIFKKEHGTKISKKNFTDQQKITEDNFNLIKYQLQEKEKKVLETINKKDIKGSQAWNLCLQTIIDLKNFEKQHMHLPLPNVIDDPDFPSELRRKIKEELRKNNINPERIKLQCTNDEAINCTAASPLIHWLIRHNSLLLSLAESNHGSIIINPKSILKLSPNDRYILCLRMVEAIVHQSSVDLTVLEYFGPENMNISLAALQKRYITNHLIHIALKNPYYSSMMLKHIFEHPLPDLNTDTYDLLKHIDITWKTLRWFKINYLLTEGKSKTLPSPRKAKHKYKKAH